MTSQYWDSYHDFFAKVSSRKMTKVFARYELFKRVIDLPGDIVECGVFKGGGVLLWAHLLQIFNQFSIRRVVGFDTFAGFPLNALSYEHDRQTAQLIQEQDPTYTQTSVEEIINIASKLGIENRIELVSGDATVTIQNYVKGAVGFRIALLNLDFDVYDPTIVALEYLYPLVVPGGIIILDEYSVRGLGESDAVDEFFRDKPISLHQFPWSRSPRAFIVKNS